MLFVTEGKDAETINAFAENFTAQDGDLEAVESTSIDMSPAFIKGVTGHLPNTRITFDKVHVIARASTAVDKTRRIEQKADSSLKGLCWKLLRDRASLTPNVRIDLDALVAQVTTKRTTRAWLYKEQLREILEASRSMSSAICSRDGPPT
ncbi:transposase [mine drainage metagenome]|uniref:Transposase n=1 Tax=mine drainage metagenome TaxID=410659 RepID=A0A1J5SZS6_9ZZZZ